ncbi:response regulator transcription factor [Acidocella sp.]|uniref:response regulator transcription factor n=1 Tax=Acidocella sp. TaxID=50710 RepID=UPI0026171964|nr:response regulator transcription factor [Acidocella sp.]
MRILLIEDDEDMSGFLAGELEAEGYEVALAANGRDGLMQAATGDFDLFLIDRMLPHLDGLGVVQALRSMQIATSVIMITALGRVDERVRGLRAGADDYIVKPFAVPELLARVEAVRRRKVFRSDQSLLKVADLTLNRLTQSALRGEQRIPLKPREFRLLEYLMLNAGVVVTRTMLLEEVWDYHFDPQTKLVESHICRIRLKIDRGFPRELIQTIRGSGYRIVTDGPV